MEKNTVRFGLGQTALITGASGGLGKEFAIIYAKHGFNLVLVARSEDKLKSLADKLSKEFDVNVKVIAADLSETDGAEKVYQKLKEEHIFIDQLVNNAGAGKQAATVDADTDTLRGLINLNAVSLTLLCRLIGADMVRAGHGKILNVSSLGAFIPDPYFNVYGPTKAFELFLTQAMYGELIGTGVSVSVLCPGPIKTNWAKNAGKADSKTAKEPREIAVVGFKKMQKGKLLIIPAPIYRIERFAVDLLPMTARIRVIRKWQGGLIKKNQHR
jgi:short-subunit dehydrogenase